MGTKSSKPLDGENDGSFRCKADIFGKNIRTKFDSGELRLSDTELSFTGTKASFQWSILGLKRFGSAKKVFTVEINEHDDKLDTREIKFKSKHAETFCERFRTHLEALETANGTKNAPAAEDSNEATADGKDNTKKPSDLEGNGTKKNATYQALPDNQENSDQVNKSTDHVSDQEKEDTHINDTNTQSKTDATNGEVVVVVGTPPGSPPPTPTPTITVDTCSERSHSGSEAGEEEEKPTPEPDEVVEAESPKPNETASPAPIAAAIHSGPSPTMPASEATSNDPASDQSEPATIHDGTMSASEATSNDPSDQSAAIHDGEAGGESLAATDEVLHPAAVDQQEDPKSTEDAKLEETPIANKDPTPPEQSPIPPEQSEEDQEK